MIESLDAEIIAILQLLITYIYIDILYIKCPGHVLDITKFMSMDGTVLDVPSMNIVPSHYQHCLDDPMEIYFVQKKELKTSVATVKCKIKRLKIPAMTVDSGAEPPIITENIVERVGAKIDKSETHDLSGIATVPVESVGVVRKLPITLAPGCTIHEDFIVVKYHKPTLNFPTNF